MCEELYTYKAVKNFPASVWKKFKICAYQREMTLRGALEMVMREFIRETNENINNIMENENEF